MLVLADRSSKLEATASVLAGMPQVKNKQINTN